MSLHRNPEGARATRDDPDAYLPGDRRRALAQGGTLPDRVRGAALFADISGFTPLTEALAHELGPHRGAEELTAHLNRVFRALIDELHRHGGDVIYFSGDAITCWLDGDDGLRAAACGLAMQQAMDRVGDVVTPGGITVRLAMKAAVSAGAARRFVVGDPAIQRIDVLAGRLIDELAAAEHHAERGEVVLGASALNALGTRVELRARRVDAATGSAYGVLARVVAPVPDAPARVDPPALPESVVREWLLPAVYERVRTGRGEFLAELRPAYPLFVRFGGIDYDEDDDAIGKLDAFVCGAQRVLTAFGGNLLHVTLGDKGAYLCAVFGAPLAHEDDAQRAAAASLELRKLEHVCAVKALQIGIAYGRLRSGTYGHDERRTYTCLGDSVNLAARLMAKAPPGEIFVAEAVQRAAGDAFEWQPLPPLALKGKAEPVSAFVLTASRRPATHAPAAADALPMVGRSAELAVMGRHLAGMLDGEGRLVGISAEAGMGKSRLAAEFVRVAAARGALVAVGECQAYGTNTGYFVWREIWKTLFGLAEDMPEETKVAALAARLAAIDPALVARLPLLAGLLGLSLPDSELTARFDAKLRKTSLEGLLLECLRARAGEVPLVLTLEDCHWLDPLSRDLLEVLARATADMRVLLVLAYRPAKQAGGGLGIEQLPHFEEIALEELDRESATLVIRAKLQPILGPGAAPPAALVELVAERAQGNPFYIEELLNFIRSKGADLRDEAAVRKLELPESLHTLILSRIDTLGESSRRPLKVASVLGRVFRATMLPSLYPELGGFDEVNAHLRTLAGADLVNIDQEAEETWLFKHVVTQEVAYESMPFAFRAMLHERVGGLLEATGPEAVERQLDLLAHHYGLSTNLAKKREFLARAGVAAQAAYANASAIDYFEKLAPLVEDSARADVLLKLGKVLELTGKWVRAEEVDGEALALAQQHGDARARATCETALAEVARKQGRYEEAVARLDRARRDFDTAGDDAGVGMVLHLAGTLAAQRGDYPKAVENYEASLAIRQRLGDKAALGSLLSNLGVIAEYRGEYARSREFHESALAYRAEIGDRWALGVSMNNLGMIEVLQKNFSEAREWFTKSMLLCREVGDGWMVAIGHNNLGNATRGLGDYVSARMHYAESLRAYRDYGDRWALAFLVEDIAVLAARLDDAETALELLGAADGLRESLGAPRSPSLDEELAAEMAAAVDRASEEVRATARLRGRTFSLETAINCSLAFCRRP
jgi:predicted ATPase/class 3 adenylate cyclase